MSDIPERVTFWCEIPGASGLTHCPAANLGRSAPICAVCREPEQGHARRARRHTFAPMTDPGLTLDVTYPSGETIRRHNVPLGRGANCWTLDDAGNMPKITGQFNINLADALVGKG